MTEKLTFVNENDEPIGEGPREEAWVHGYYTRNIRVVLRDQKGRFLTQKRSSLKKTYPGMWTVAASGHVDAGEDWDVAAKRETKEEIGVTADLKLIGDFIFKDDEGTKKIRQIVRVYEAIIDSATPLTLQEEEVEESKWYDFDELFLAVDSTPELFTPSFLQTVNNLYR